jgi:hypothetical protein
VLGAQPGEQCPREQLRELLRVAGVHRWPSPPKARRISGRRLLSVANARQRPREYERFPGVRSTRPSVHRNRRASISPPNSPTSFSIAPVPYLRAGAPWWR